MKKKILSMILIIVTLCSILCFGIAINVNASTGKNEYNLLINGGSKDFTRGASLTRITFGYAWASTPVSVYASSSFSSTYISQLQQAIAAWNSTRVGTVLVYKGTLSNPYLVSNAIGVTSASLTSFTDVAKTIDTHNESNIIKSMITLNSNYSFNNGSTSSGTYYLKSVFMHELGHALGIDDNDDSSSIMYRYYTGSTSISSGDVNDLNSMY